MTNKVSLMFLMLAIPTFADEMLIRYQSVGSRGILGEETLRSRIGFDGGIFLPGHDGTDQCRGCQLEFISGLATGDPGSWSYAEGTVSLTGGIVEDGQQILPVGTMLFSGVLPALSFGACFIDGNSTSEACLGFQSDVTLGSEFAGLFGVSTQATLNAGFVYYIQPEGPGSQCYFGRCALPPDWFTGVLGGAFNDTPFRLEVGPEQTTQAARLAPGGVEAVPEPQGFVLLGSLLVGLAWFRARISSRSL